MKKVITENRNEFTKDIDLIDSVKIVEKINREDKKVIDSVYSQKNNIALAIDTVALAFQNNGRLFYFGAGTSGRLGVLDASECPPTFGVDSNMVQGIIAGGDNALRYAIEGAEDDFDLGASDAQKLKSNDVAVLISASGNPSYLLGVQKIAKEKGTKIIALTSNPNAKILEKSDIKIITQVGAEVIAGSSRMKSGTAQKMVLNMISTGAMVKIGKTYENFMIDVKATNEKLKKRAIGIVMDLTDCDEKTAKNALVSSDWNVKLSSLMLKKNISLEKAKTLLKESQGILRRAFEK
ncbi:N-acetylmuramic acid 6-phosphate etherase [bacterium]|nr:N-acetylmuramic acid 6-phosphate etherase [bacterium]